MMRHRLTLALSLLAAACPSTANAQPFPSRPITIVLGLAAGTGMDTVVRLYADKLSQRLGKPVIVENRPGASQNIASGGVAQAIPDGHVLLAATSAPMAIQPTVYKQLPFDPQRDFVPIALYVKSPFILIVEPAVPAHSVPELIAFIKAQPAPPSYSSAGTGGLQHLAMELFTQRFDLKVTHVPYRNSPQSIADVAAGHVSLAIAEAGVSVPLIRDAKLRALAVTASQRLPLLPATPSLVEATGAAELEAVSWHALLAPINTPREIVERLHAEMKDIMAAPEMRQKIEAIGLIPNEFPTIEQMQRYMIAEREKWGALVRKVGLENSQ